MAKGKITRSFTFHDGYDVLGVARKSGFSQLRADADYDWTMANPKTNEIMEFKEGDLIIEKFKNPEDFKRGLRRYLNWYKKNYGMGSYKEMKENLEDLNLLKFKKKTEKMI